VGDSDDLYVPYYNALLQNETFRERVKEIYDTEFVPLLDELMDRGIEELASSIREASAMNLVRWNDLYSTLQIDRQQVVISVNELKTFLEEREAFLKEALNHIADYNLVYVNVGNYYLSSVRIGEQVELPEPESLGITNFVRWINAETGEEFDSTQPITSDIIIKAEVSETVVQVDLIHKIWNNKKKIVYAASLCVFLLAISSFVVLDIRRNGKGAWPV
jgi:hypothetical protein